MSVGSVRNVVCHHVDKQNAKFTSKNHSTYRVVFSCDLFEW